MSIACWVCCRSSPRPIERLGGPRCVYVGHPLIERLADLRPNPDEARRRNAEPPVLVVLPGSRRSEIRRLMADFGGALGRLQEAIGPFAAILPTLPHIEAEVRARAALWPVAPRIVLGEAAKLEAFRTARAALAASGTVTLELALAGVPLVGAYKVGKVEEQLKYLIKVPSILLPNLILADRTIPEKLQRDCNPAALAAELAALMRDGPERDAQIEGLARLDATMRLPDGAAPSAHAARAVMQTIGARRPPLTASPAENAGAADALSFRALTRSLKAKKRRILFSLINREFFWTRRAKAPPNAEKTVFSKIYKRFLTC